MNVRGPRKGAFFVGARKGSKGLGGNDRLEPIADVSPRLTSCPESRAKPAGPRPTSPREGAFATGASRNSGEELEP
jgi:hypothetical protein